MDEMDWKDQRFLEYLNNISSETNKEEWFASEIILEAEGKSVMGHSIILCAVSSYFRAMESAGLREVDEKSIKFPDFNFEALVQLVNFTYTGEILLKKSNFLEIMRITDYLGIGYLKQAIIQFLFKTLNEENCLDALAHTNLYGYTDVVPDILNFICKNFHAVTNSSRYLNAPAYIVQMVTCNHRLTFNTAFNGLQKWLKPRIHGIKPRTDSVQNLHLYLDQCIAQTKDCCSVVDLLNEFKKFTVQKIQEIEYSEFSVRKSHTYISAIFCIGGKNDKSAIRSSECYTDEYSWSMLVPDTQGKFRTIPTLVAAKFDFAYACRDQAIFIFGGSDGDTVFDTCEKYDVATNEWTVFTQMPKRLYGAAAAFMNNMIFVTGGMIETCNGTVSTKDVLVFNEKTKNWKVKQCLQNARAFHSMCSVQGSLFVLGGLDFGKIVWPMEQYSEAYDQWWTVNRIPEKISHFGCVTYEKYIYTFGGHTRTNCLRNVVCRYDTWEHTWEKLGTMPVCRAGLQCVVRNDRVYCIGGYDSIRGPRATVLVYNPRTDRWHHLHHRILIPRSNGAAVLVHIYPTHI